MERGTVEEVPEKDELLQQDPPVLSVPVRVEGPIQTYRLPNRRVQFSTDTVGADSFVQVHGATPKRARGVLVAIDEAVYINNRSSGGGMIWPAGVPYTFEHTQAVYVKAAQNTTDVGLSVELWAD